MSLKGGLEYPTLGQVCVCCVIDGAVYCVCSTSSSHAVCVSVLVLALWLQPAELHRCGGAGESCLLPTHSGVSDTAFLFHIC